jgi:hypothetical protein
MATRKQRQQTRKIKLTEYIVNREYGGPEEGGWWYDVGEPIVGTTETFYSRERASDRFRVRQDACDKFNKAHYPYMDLGSVLCTGSRRICFTYGGDAPDYFPKQRPHYE